MRAVATTFLVLTSFLSPPPSSSTAAIELPDHHPHALNSTPAGCSSDRHNEDPPGRKQPTPNLKLHLKRFPHGAPPSNSMSTIINRDLARIHTFQTRRMTAERGNKFGAASSRPSLSRSLREAPSFSSPIMATLRSGVSQGSGEYLVDVYLGTPPRHFSLILDTASDLNWIQCIPCYDCFEQSGPHYDPTTSSSYRNVSCADPRCRHVPSPENPRPPCHSPEQPCRYFYPYGTYDSPSNTTGDLALESFTFNLTATGDPLRVDGVLFGCGHRNRGQFHGAAGVIGMGGGPLSLPSQLRKHYGHTFSYCLVEFNSDASVTSKLIFGEELSSEFNYTSLEDHPDDTFYYVDVKGVMVGGKLLENIPSDVWELSSDGGGGTILDSGATLSYFALSAYKEIKAAFKDQVGDRLPLLEDFPMKELELCYNVSGVAAGDVPMPEFAIIFADGALWRFPEGNSLVRLSLPDIGEVTCLAMRQIPNLPFNMLGNILQQNVHIAFDAKKSRLGFAPTNCALL